MIKADWREFDDGAAMAGAVATAVAALIRASIDSRGKATLAVAGGKTPIPAFRLLAEERLDWARVRLLPTDDRLVAPVDALSNFGLMRGCFGETGAMLVPLADGPGDPREAGKIADRRLQDLDWPLDLVWLGIGADGHTASILPGPDFAAALAAPLPRRAYGVTPDPLPKEAPVARVTLTRAALLDARVLILTITGTHKRALLERAIAAESQTTAIGRVLDGAAAPVTIYWSP